LKTIDEVLEWINIRKKEFKQSLQNGERGYSYLESLQSEEGGYSYWELLDNLEVFITAETEEEKQKKIFLRFHGIDCFNRPIFKEVVKNNFYGSISKVCPWNEGVHIIPDMKLEDLVYFGNSFGCEPMGNPCPDNEKWIIIE